MLGRTISHYRIQKKLGAGGMGEVYLAQDENLDRLVALKFLPEEFVSDSDRLRRFTREAKAASAISHPNVAHIYEIGHHDDLHFIVMEYVEGETLASRMQRARLSVDEIIALALQMADALREAHGKGIVHRDIKPANILLTNRDQAKLVDFGLAKMHSAREVVNSLDPTESQTQLGVALGTLPYMSPEQLLGQTLDHRTDFFSTGVVLYQMLTGRLPFLGNTSVEMADAILHKEPLEITDAPQDFSRILTKLMAKDPNARYQNAGDLIADLQRLADKRAPSAAATSPFKRWSFWLPAAVFLVIIAAFIARLFYQERKMNWARDEALLHATQLVDKGKYADALQIAEQAEKYIPNDPLLKTLWSSMATTISIQTNPSGSELFLTPYESTNHWTYAGKSPLNRKRIPKGFFRWKIVKSGYPQVEFVTPRAFFQTELHLSFDLEELKKNPPGMVRVPGLRNDLDARGASDVAPDIKDDFYLDQFEVTNEQFKKFLDAGGYTNRVFWKIPFLVDGKPLTFEQAMAKFVDSTGRPGPMQWEVGTYPAGQEKFPVVGISWYEAAAYAEFVHKTLPTISHWYQASGTGMNDRILAMSNFGARGPHAIGDRSSMSPYGNFDMAGNVEEWCWNETPDHQRILIGGSYHDPVYMFMEPNMRDPFTRSVTTGFRCAKYINPVSAELTGPFKPEFRDYTKEQPVDDSAFRVLKSFYDYEKKPLEARLESKQDMTYMVKEKVSFTAAYGTERVAAYLFIPATGHPPYQTIVYFPGSGPQSFSNSERIGAMNEPFDFLVRSGRAVICPIYKGTFERGGGPGSKQKNPDELREWRIDYIKDVRRAVDYVETRTDLNSQKLAYIGYSWGGRVGSIVGAVEQRVKTLILLHGGFPMSPRAAETDEINFAPRVKVPVLMINGRYDHVFPLQTSQEPMFKALASAPNDKVHLVFEGGHFTPRNEVIKVMLDWLDKYLGRPE